MYCLIRVFYWLFLITWPAIAFDSMACDGVIIDHVIWPSNIDFIQIQNSRFDHLIYNKYAMCHVQFAILGSVKVLLK